MSHTDYKLERKRLPSLERLTRRLLCSMKVLLTLSVATAAPHASAQDDATSESERQALQHYERAIALHADEAYDAALAELRRAYELRPSYKIVFNMAQVQLAMKDYAAALTSFQRYLDEGGLEVPEKRRADIEEQIQILKERVATVVLSTDVPGTEVFVDDVSVGKTPDIGPLVVNAGTRKFTLRHPDYETHTERVSVLGGTSRQLAFSLAHGKMTESPPNTGTTPSAPAEGESHASGDLPREDNTPWIPWVVTGALGVAALGTGLAALAADGELADLRKMPDVGRGRLEDEADQVGNLALATDLLLTATVLAGGLSAWLTWGGATREAPATGALEMKLMVSPHSASVFGRF